METNGVTHFIFVDFENVPSLDLEAMGGKSLHVTILLGKNQRKIDVSLVRQIQKNAAMIDLVEIGTSGHNALDMILAYCLGQAAQRTPDASFYIVSKDRDYEPLIVHLRARNIEVTLCPEFSLLPFLPQASKSGPTKIAKPAKSVPVDRFERLIARLEPKTAARPKTRLKLLAHIRHVFGNKLSEADVAGTVRELSKRGIIRIDDEDQVSYP